MKGCSSFSASFLLHIWLRENGVCSISSTQLSQRTYLLLASCNQPSSLFSTFPLLICLGLTPLRNSRGRPSLDLRSMSLACDTKAHPRRLWSGSGLPMRGSASDTVRVVAHLGVVSCPFVPCMNFSISPPSPTFRPLLKAGRLHAACARSPSAPSCTPPSTCSGQSSFIHPGPPWRFPFEHLSFL
ncbi:unnamed protein product [Scytosiphon promiscuus]